MKRQATLAILTAIIASLRLLAVAQGSAAAIGANLFSRPPGAWPTHNGDYSGRRYASNRQVNASNVGQLDVQWKFTIADLGQQRGGGSGAIKSTPLLVDQVLYVTVPNHVYAVDVRTGAKLWQFDWVDKGGHLIGNRGVAVLNDSVFFVAPDGWLFSLDAKTGKEKWRQKFADEEMQYYTTIAPLIVKDKLIVGVGGDAMDLRGYLEARNPETGDLVWRWYTTPLKMGDPGSETWPDFESMSHGGGMTWNPGTYDPELNLIYWGTGNANPVFAGQSREGANLYTGCIVALNADTGKLVWYFQVSPHDTHDWDSVETPVLFDAVVDGRSRKLLAQAARNGYFVVVDRTNGRRVTTAPFVGVNWSKGIDAKGQPIPDPEKEPQFEGSLINIPSQGGTNWPPPSYDPDTGLFYVQAHEGWSIVYRTDTSDKPEGYAGGGGANGFSKWFLKAIDVRTGKPRWQHEWAEPGNGGILTTAGGLLFTGVGRNAVAMDASTGQILWHYETAAPPSNGPITYDIDGKQVVLFGAGLTLYSFSLSPSHTPTSSSAALDQLPSGEGRDAVVRMCNGCHGLATVVSMRRSRNEWESIVDTMRGNGATGSDEDTKAVVHYLATHFSK